jgi:hypothetical protein
MLRRFPDLPNSNVWLAANSAKHRAQHDRRLSSFVLRRSVISTLILSMIGAGTSAVLQAIRDEIAVFARGINIFGLSSKLTRYPRKRVGDLTARSCKPVIERIHQL